MHIYTHTTMSCITTWLLLVVVVVIIVLATSNAFVTTHRRPFHPPPSFLLERQQQQQQQNIPLPPHPLSRSNLRNLNNNGNGNGSSSSSSNAVEDVKRRQLLTFTASLAAATGVVWKDPRPANAESTGRMTDKNGPIIVPPLDDRKYETFELPGNGLRVLLCSDPSLSMAAAAMDVHVGATSDPDAVPGLAHFTEHMLFLGTELYPEVRGCVCVCVFVVDEFRFVSFVVVWVKLMFGILYLFTYLFRREDLKRFLLEMEDFLMRLQVRKILFITLTFRLEQTLRVRFQRRCDASDPFSHARSLHRLPLGGS